MNPSAETPELAHSCWSDVLLHTRGLFGSFKREYVYQACLETLEEVRRQGPAWIGHYNQEAPHSAFGMQSPAEFYAAWLVTNEQRPDQN